IGYNKSFHILDIGCGTGRHSIELAKRGYTVVGIDLSESMLKRAKEKAANENIKIDFIQADARHLDYNNEFDLIIMLCEGAFPLMETDEMNYTILKNAANALTRNGKLIFTTLNGLFPLFHSVKDFINKNSSEGTSQESTFDLMTFRDTSTYEVVDDSGNKKTLKCNERYYVPSEITWFLKSLDFKKIDLLGCLLGKWSREIQLTTEDFEMLVVADK
ncbi:MAG: class I SAM-dependent methyltransferase, partial [Bacteroidetes bacterium]|nr:class I SAM-dependent methyltransferase [Bacteroidota bacterium]